MTLAEAATRLSSADPEAFRVLLREFEPVIEQGTQPSDLERTLRYARALGRVEGTIRVCRIFGDL